MKNALIAIAATVGVIGALLWFGSRSRSSETITPSRPNPLVSQEQSYDFGIISMAAGPVSHDFAIKNTGTTMVTITKVYTSCMCTEALFIANGKTAGPFGMPGHGALASVNQELGVGAEATIRAIFDPAAHGPAGVGPISRAVTIQTDDGHVVQLTFRAVVTP